MSEYFTSTLYYLSPTSNYPKFYTAMNNKWSISTNAYVLAKSSGVPVFTTKSDATMYGRSGSTSGQLYTMNSNTVVCIKSLELATSYYAEQGVEGSKKTLSPPYIIANVYVNASQANSSAGYIYLGTISSNGEINFNKSVYLCLAGTGPSSSSAINSCIMSGTSGSYSLNSMSKWILYEDSAADSATSKNITVQVDSSHGTTIKCSGNILWAGGIDNSYNSTAVSNVDTTLINSITTAYNDSQTSSSSDSDTTWYTGVLSTQNSYYVDYSDHMETEKIEAWQTYASENNASLDYERLRGIFGLPYQWLPSTDCRIYNNSITDSLERTGYEFSYKVMSVLPLLYITPGNTGFCASASDNEKSTLLSNIKLGNMDGISDMLDNYTGKLYTLSPSYAEYYRYVNLMCRTGSIFLDIGNEEIGINGSTTKCQSYDWANAEGQAYELYVEEEGDTEESAVAESTGEETDEVEQEQKSWFYDWIRNGEESWFSEWQSYIYYQNCIPFCINSEYTFQEDFSNEITESSLASSINGLSDQARELQFLMGTATSALDSAFDKIGVGSTISSIEQSINDIVDNISSGNNIFSVIAGSVKSICTGGRLVFPQIWSNASYSRSYNINIRLISPSSDRFAWWLNIYVPLCHLAALVMPRSEFVNTYSAPFIIKAFYKGMFNIDMGIITSMSFTRGAENGGWNNECLPLVVDVSFTIQDLYSALGMTSEGNMFAGFTIQNTAELDWMANWCGVNINEPDMFRMIDMWAVLHVQDTILDIIPNMKNEIANSLGNWANKLYTNLWF